MGLILIDGNNLAFRAAAATKLSVGDQDTQAIYHFIDMIQDITDRYSNLKPIVLWDGLSWRKSAFTGYKSSGDKEPETKNEIAMAEVKKSLATQLRFIQEGLEYLGVAQVNSSNLEADDLAALFVRRNKDKKILLISSDKDWLQLVSKNVSWLDTMNNEHITLAKFEEKIGVKEPYQFLQVKAIMGDKSDDVEGIGGIGKQGAIKLVNEYGSVSEFLNRFILDYSSKEGREWYEKLPKKYKDFGEVEEKVNKFAENMSIIDLNSPLVPRPENLLVTKGSFDEEKFREFCYRFLLSSILKRCDEKNWLDCFKR